METYFNIALEFDKQKVDESIVSAIRNSNAGYVCVVNANIIATAERDPFYKQVINGALVNICDGSIVALVLSIINLREYKPYVGADLFINYIKYHQDYRYLFLGSNIETLDGVREYLIKFNPDIKESIFLPLPFRDNPKDFNYQQISLVINENKPDIILVSLGAPKQEQFMFYLKPHLKKGIMFGLGAAFSFYSGNPKLKRAPLCFRLLKLEWFYRICQEPRRLIKRFKQELFTMTKLSYNQLMNKK
jgi:N-acetylglucosaminyldiphosphoundecaprenol N-acetyl-beta-D-mannosaminyltransferase